MTNVSEDNNFFGLIIHILTHKIECMWDIIRKVI